MNPEMKTELIKKMLQNAKLAGRRAGHLFILIYVLAGFIEVHFGEKIRKNIETRKTEILRSGGQIYPDFQTERRANEVRK